VACSATVDGEVVDAAPMLRAEVHADGSVDLRVHIERSDVRWVDEVCLLDGLLDDDTVAHNHRWFDHIGFQQSTAVFFRSRRDGRRGGAFASYANPLATATIDEATGRVWLAYRPAMAVGGAFVSDPLVVGRVVHEGREIRRRVLPGRDIAAGKRPMYVDAFGPPETAAFDAGEVRSIRSAVSSRTPWTIRRPRRSGACSTRSGNTRSDPSPTATRRSGGTRNLRGRRSGPTASRRVGAAWACANCRTP
jgi:hypothetical protein